MATDDPNKGAEDKPEAGAKPARRKPPTLDLAAKEVVSVPDDAATGDTAPEAAAPETVRANPPATDVAAPSEAPALDAADASPPDTPVPPAEPSEAGETRGAPPEPVHPIPPPAAPRSPRTLGVIGTLFAALLSGVIGAAFALAVVSAFSNAEQNVDAITDLEARALDLRQRVELLETRSGEAAAPGLDAPAELATRLDALESGLDSLGKKVDTLPAAPASAGAGTAPVASSEDVAAVRGQIEALEQRVGALPAPVPAASPADLDATNTRLKALEDKLGAATAAQRESGQGAAQMVMLGRLREAVASGRPFATELKAAQSLLGSEGASLAALEPAAANGFATGPALAAQLRTATAPATATEPTPEAAAEEGFAAKLLSGAKKLVTVRRSEDAASTPALAQAEAALARDDVDAARAALAALPESERTAAQPVLAALDARQAALATIAELDRRVLATLAGGAQ
ncbi:COG4223 family protein [Ancylobacter sp.]|uniref:COG4223 family protein n=1 Tax=Ancylobacter sp. TaxID=1872567 RepID=UPI003D123D07